MINGFPHKTGGLFEVACGFVEKSLSRSVQSNVIDLGGFPAPRAEKYLKRALNSKPDYVVIQFGSTDAACSIRARHHSISPSSNSGDSYERVGFHPPTAFTFARWQIASLAGFFWNTGPTTPLNSYIEAIGHMVDHCMSAGITPVVLSPFVFGSRHSMRSAILYSNALRELHSRVKHMIFVDCIRLLSKYSKSRILLNDGMHLSLLGHNLIGEEIGKAIVANVGSQSTSASMFKMNGTA